MGVTLASQSSGASRSRVTPLEAFRTGKTTRPFTVRIAAGSAVLLPGLILMAIGMFGNPVEPQQRSPASASAERSRLLVFHALGNVCRGSRRFHWPTGSKTARCDRSNPSRQRSRNPQRTSSTVTALDWACTHLRSCSSYQINFDSFEEVLSESISADLWVFESNQRLEFSGLLVDQLAELPEVDHIAGFSPCGAN